MEKYTTSIDIGITAEEAPVMPKPRRERDHGKEHVHEREREHEHSRKKRGGIGFYFVNILFGVVILAVVLVILVMTLFDLRNIEYEGVNNSNPMEIQNALFSDSVSGNTLLAWIANQVTSHDEIPFVSQTFVYLKNKNTVMVSVKEDELTGYIEASDGRYIYFDSNARVVEISKRLIDNVPKVEGFQLTDQKDHEELNVDVSKRTSVCELIKYLKDINIVPMGIIYDRDGTYGFYIDSIFVDLGIPDNVRDKVNRLTYILPNLAGRTGTLHMEEWGRENSDIVFEQM